MDGWMDREIAHLSKVLLLQGKKKVVITELVAEMNGWMEVKRDRGSEKGPPTYTHTQHTHTHAPYKIRGLPRHLAASDLKKFFLATRWQGEI